MLNLCSLRTAAAALALSVATVGAADAAGYSRNFTAHNYHYSTVVAFYIKPVDYDNWTALSGDRIPPGASDDVTINGFPGECYFELEARFANGTTSTGTFNLCATTDINV